MKKSNVTMTAIQQGYIQIEDIFQLSSDGRVYSPNGFTNNLLSPNHYYHTRLPYMRMANSSFGAESSPKGNWRAYAIKSNMEPSGEVTSIDATGTWVSSSTTALHEAVKLALRKGILKRVSHLPLVGQEVTIIEAENPNLYNPFQVGITVRIIEEFMVGEDQYYRVITKEGIDDYLPAICTDTSYLRGQRSAIVSILSQKTTASQNAIFGALALKSKG